MYYYNLEEKDNQRYVIVDLNKEELGGSQAMEFYQVINKFIDDKIDKIFIDFKNVNLMNSSGLGMIASSYREIQGSSSKLILVNIPEKIMKLLKMTQLDKIFTIE